MTENTLDLTPKCVEGLKVVLHKLDDHIKKTERITEALRKYQLADEKTIADVKVSISNNPDHPFVAQLEELIRQYEEVRT